MTDAKFSSKLFLNESQLSKLACASHLFSPNLATPPTTKKISLTLTISIYILLYIYINIHITLNISNILAVHVHHFQISSVTSSCVAHMSITTSINAEYVHQILGEFYTHTLDIQVYMRSQVSATLGQALGGGGVHRHTKESTDDKHLGVYKVLGATPTNI